jgi:hypothetical protein
LEVVKLTITGACLKAVADPLVTQPVMSNPKIVTTTPQTGTAEERKLVGDMDFICDAPGV